MSTSSLPPRSETTKTGKKSSIEDSSAPKTDPVDPDLEALKTFYGRVIPTDPNLEAVLLSVGDRNYREIHQGIRNQYMRGAIGLATAYRMAQHALPADVERDPDPSDEKLMKFFDTAIRPLIPSNKAMPKNPRWGYDQPMTLGPVIGMVEVEENEQGLTINGSYTEITEIYEKYFNGQMTTNQARAKSGLPPLSTDHRIPGSSPSTPGTTLRSTLTWRERSSYLTNRDWLVLETGPESS
jgi:hypothetical protein